MILKKVNAKGVIQFWKIQIEGATIHVEWGIENGKTQTNSHTITEGKQKRSREEQAQFEADSLIKKKLRSGYTNEDSKDDSKSPLPMLAKEYKTQKFDGKTIAIQPKLDGIRCIANVKTGELWSRKQTKIHGLEHISKKLLNMKFPDNILWLDGELYCHTMNFNQISSKVRRITNFTDSLDIQYWVYDCILNDSFQKRCDLLSSSIQDSDVVVFTSTQFMLFDADKITKIHKEATNDNYEGIMIRNVESTYDMGKRSSNLLKMKDFCQEEYIVIGFNQKKVVNDNVTLGSIILQSSDKTIQFNATPSMTNEEKQEIWQNQNMYLGKIGTVKFFEKTPKGIPRFPRLIGFRDVRDC